MSTDEKDIEVDVKDVDLNDLHVNIEEAIQFGKDSLPLRIKDPKQKTGYRLAKPGETTDDEGNHLPQYEIFGSLRQLDEFGIGISIYFRQLLVYAIIFAISGCIYLPSMYHMSKPEQSDGFACESGKPCPCWDGKGDEENINWEDITCPGNNLLRGSAYGASFLDIEFSSVQRNSSVLVFFFLAVFKKVMDKMQERAEKFIDEGQQTAQDYAVVFKNPPKNITDPDEYKEFFSQFGGVVYVSVILNNGKLLRSINNLITARTLADKKKFLVEKAGTQDDEKSKKSIEKLQEKVEKLSSEIEELSDKEYEAKRVFLIMNKEKSKAQLLKKYNLRPIERICTFCTSVPRFHDVIPVLDEPGEPSEQLYQYYDYGNFRRFVNECFSLTLVAILLGICFGILFAARQAGGTFAAIIIALINYLLPKFIFKLSTEFEVHFDQGDQQGSIFMKLVSARCLNTCILTYALLRPADIDSHEFMNGVASVLIADAFTAPILKVSGTATTVKRLLAKNPQFTEKIVKTQTEAKVLFSGMMWKLSERYTDISKTAFVGLFYSAIFPAGLWITALAMLINFCTDRFMLFRKWKRPPAFDGILATKSQNVFAVALVIYMIMQNSMTARWPFEEDPSNRTSKSTGADYRAGNHFLWIFSAEQAIGESDEAFEERNACIDFYNGFLGFLYFTGAFLMFGQKITDKVKALFKKEEEDGGLGAYTNIEFRSLEGISPYIGNMENLLHPDPFLAANTVGVPYDCLPVRQNIEVDLNVQNFNSAQYLPNVKSQEARDKLFSTTKFYPKTEKDVDDEDISTGITLAPQLGDVTGIQMVDNQLNNMLNSSGISNIMTPDQLKSFTGNPMNVTASTTNEEESEA